MAPGFQTNPRADPSATIVGPKYRFTVLTDRLIRYEWADDGHFEDRPSTFAIDRAFDKPEFNIVNKEGSLEIITAHLHLSYDKKYFSAGGLTAEIKAKLTLWGSQWRYGIRDDSNLGGTARTLDDTNGRCDLGEGLLAHKGFVAIDDSSSMLFEDDFVGGRRPGDRIDGYLFAYGHDYKGAIKAFYQLSGQQPILPRWALGNWWSRYYAYSQDEYIQLMEDFKEHAVPLSVAVIDMDWHIVGDAPHAGWTGYTWDKKLFPDPARFGKNLHDKHLKITLNDHPHAGIHYHEDAYEEVAAALGHDTSQRLPIPFDASSPEYMQAYFKIVLRNLEKDGCDFWWIDWQQGTYSKTEGLDPLWVLNHYHFLHNREVTKTKPLIFSRYAGLGSHRYPVGFSGDTTTSWESLKFQPEFTATASNVGYGWWSHDIGGHINGIRQSELYTRWVQYGCFSPILRLHSMNSRWISKEPWLYKDGDIAETFLKLRHALVPYIYTEMIISAARYETLIQPMYWSFPERQEAYSVPNQYFFGQQLIVSPIVEPNNPHTSLGRSNVWLPPGRYVDFFTGTVYDGDRKLTVWRPLDNLPIFIKQGSIIPLADQSRGLSNDCRSPKAFDLLVVIGSDAKYQILEDDPSSAQGSQDNAGKLVAGDMEYSQHDGKLIAKVKGRDWTFRFLGVERVPSNLKVTTDGQEVEPDSVKVEKTPYGKYVCVTLRSSQPSEFVIDLGSDPQLAIQDHRKEIETILRNYEGELITKNDIWEIVDSDSSLNVKMGNILSLGLDSELTGPVLELLLADGRAGKD